MYLPYFAVGIVWLVVGITTANPVFAILSVVWFSLATTMEN